MAKKLSDVVGLVDVPTTVIILDARSLAYCCELQANQRLPEKAAIEMGQVFNYPLMADENTDKYDKLKAVITDIPQRSASEGITMVATIMHTKQVQAIAANGKDQIAEVVNISEETLDDIINKFKKGSPEFKEIKRYAR